MITKEQLSETTLEENTILLMGMITQLTDFIMMLLEEPIESEGKIMELEVT
jgi:hypothetical protein